MKSFLRILKSVIGWFLAVLFGVVAVYAAFDGETDALGAILACALLAAVGVVLILSARKDKRKEEARAEEERQYRRRQEAEERDYCRRVQREATPFVTVECPGCGATARLRKGEAARCEYCGTTLGERQK